MGRRRVLKMRNSKGEIEGRVMVGVTSDNTKNIIFPILYLPV